MVLKILKILQTSFLIARILSLAWHPSGKYLIAGTSDSCIRKFSVETGRLVSRISVASKKDEETLVWATLVLPDGQTIVSGDSLGTVCFWDWNNGSLKQALKVHGADVLCLTANNVI